MPPWGGVAVGTVRASVRDVMTSPDSPTASRRFAGRYQIGNRHGAGVEATTFDALDTELGTPVALRLVHPDLSADPGFRERFGEVMARAAAIEHPNLARILGHGAAMWNGRRVLYAVSEFLTGGSVRDLLDRGRLLSPSQGLIVGLDACKGLDALHRAGILHGEIRPATLLFDDSGRLRVTDAGLSQVISERIWAPGHAPRQEFAMYAPPERATGEAIVAESDVYSLALTVVEAVTGRLPFVGENAAATLAARVDRLLPVDADLGALAAVLEHAARPAVADRYTAVEFGKALMHAAGHLPRPTPIPTLSPTGSSRRPRVVAATPSSAPSQPAVTAPPATLSQPAPGSQPAPTATTLPPPAAPPPVAPPPVAPPQVSRPAPLPATQAMPSVAPAPFPDVPPSQPVRPANDLEATIAQPAVTGAGTADTLYRTPFDDRDDVPATAILPAQVAVAPPTIYDEGPRRRVPLWVYPLVVVLLAAAGGVAWWLSRPPTYVVPDLAGQGQAQAANSASHWKVVIAREFSDVAIKDTVIRTDPPAGSRLAKGRSLTLVVSDGPAPVPIPDMVGRPFEEIAAQLTSAGLEVSRAQDAFDETIPKGSIVSFEVPASKESTVGDTLTKGTEIVLTVSAGPSPRVVPPLVGLSVEAALEQLDQLGLVLDELPQEFSNDTPAGQIARQDPAVGERIAKGSTVSVAVSKGPDLVKVPTVTGLDATGIKSVLETTGFTVGAIIGDESQPLVRMTSGGAAVSAGQDLVRHSVIDLEFAPTPTTAPPTSVPSTDP